MMNKQQLIKNLGYVRYSDTDDERYNYYNKGIDTAISFAKKLAEPEKPVVPQFVADWYEENKNDFEYSLYRLCIDFYGRKLHEDLHEWFKFDKNKPIETLILMHKFGYEVEKEKVYTVELPNPNRADVSLVLGVYNGGKVAIFANYTDDWKYKEQYQLTEAEIKQDFEWAWQFAEKVEE
ncbi:DUF1642 domain-containing protein [Streptococcus gallolyticus]|uniref:DUF1642 domain-containing protein n=1 Tax=Streptococcus gallolyticus TaxID=315405 RepID=UPI000800CEB3|nr:DUF1642 domain-containing protein [Streptococcus gallolyticus]OAV82345.1 hypothetical protein A3651_02065 [Streptococcus gallolyticus subsp. gallolyticus]